jgi:hypothetical protein
VGATVSKSADRIAELGLPDDETRGLPSPDVADAFVLTFAEVGRGRQ